MRRRHRMPFGAEVRPEGTRFRLWAPAVAQVGLHLENPPRELVMTPLPDGWHELTVPNVGVGSRYRYRVQDDLLVPDPASRSNPDDVHGPSQVIDPEAFDWNDVGWRGRPWEEAAIYELHVGSFTPEGTFKGVESRLDYLADLGVTAIELMPVADFPGRHNWGYDGVLPFAPDASYGSPADFKRLIAAAHARGLMVLLDVVYNHFGPDGNYLSAYAPDFFNPCHHTPWGAAINFDGPSNRTVRDFFIHNALYWLDEYHLDGLRLDAVHAICDDGTPDIVEELCAAVRAGPGRERHIHLVLENDRNQARYLGRDKEAQPVCASAQWNDDIHHACHVLATGESDGYYADYATDALGMLARCLSTGFAFQGDVSPYRDHAPRGEPSAHLPPAAFVNFLQTHDQVGNRAFGERLCHLADPAALEALAAVLLLAPQPPLLFMGEEFAAAQPFLFFCDFADNPELARAVTAGRRREFAKFSRFSDASARERIPDPNADATFSRCVLDWPALDTPAHARMRELYRELLRLRQRHIAPRLAGMGGGTAHIVRPAPNLLRIAWRLGDGSTLELLANPGAAAASGVGACAGTALYLTANLDPAALAAGRMPPWSATWHLTEQAGS